MYFFKRLKMLYLHVMWPLTNMLMCC